MKPTQCIACQAYDLYFTTLDADSGVVLRGSFLNWVGVKCSVCLSCGFVAPYVAADDLDKVRKWKANARNDKAAVDRR